jgi:tRNA1(Val) A37 N6-methylase TrmN6
MSRDAFLGGRLHLEQSDQGFRSGSDAVLLAAAVPARPGQSVLDLGCGAGAAMYCLGARIDDLRLTGVELDPEAAALARRNGSAEVVEADVLALPPALRGQWDHVLLNPPYFAAGAGSEARNTSRKQGLREAAPGDLRRWVGVACRRVAPKGSVTVIARADRLADLLLPMAEALGGIAVLPIAATEGTEARRVLVQGRLGARSPLRLLSPLVLHSGPESGGYRPEVETILRHGGVLRLI